jgi:hypothetical protein
MSIEAATRPLTHVIEGNGLITSDTFAVRELAANAFAAEGGDLNTGTVVRVVTNIAASLSAELAADHPDLPLHGRNDSPTCSDMNTVNSVVGSTIWWMMGGRYGRRGESLYGYVERTAFEGIIESALQSRVERDPNVTIKRGDKA